jgi:hypothetical protein
MIAEHIESRILLPRCDRSPHPAFLQLTNPRGAHRVFELKDQTRSDGTHDVGRATLLSVFDVGQVVVFGRIDVGHRSAAGYIWDPIGEQ